MASETDAPATLDILVVSPHPDDAELGMAGTMMKCREEGLAVGVLDLTDGEPTPFGSPEVRRRETAAATRILGIAWRENLGPANRSLEATLEARAKLAAVFRRTRPRWIFAPYWIDAHPDHVAATSTDRGRPLLVETDQDRFAGRAVLSRANLLLLLRPSADRFRSRRLCWTLATNGSGSRRRSSVTAASSSRAGRRRRPPSSIIFATRRPPGVGRSAPATASPSPAASRSG